MPDMEFLRPATLTEALAFLAARPNARCISGGATLVAMMNADLVEPAALISLEDIAELKGITREGTTVRIGAMTRHNETATSPLFRKDNASCRLALRANC